MLIISILLVIVKETRLLLRKKIHFEDDFWLYNRPTGWQQYSSLAWRNRGPELAVVADGGRV